MKEEQAALPPKSQAMWSLIGLFGFSNYLLRTVLGYIAVSMDHEGSREGSGSNSNSKKAVILSAFFVGYASNNVLSGVFASRFGGMNVLHAACTGWSLCAMMIPTAFDLSEGDVTSVALVMFLLGICCAPMFPASQTVLSYFSTPATISIGTSIRAGGAHGGSIVATFVTPILLSVVGWRYLLQIYGALGLVIVVVSLTTGPSGGNQLKRSNSLVITAPEDVNDIQLPKKGEDGEYLVDDNQFCATFPPAFPCRNRTAEVYESVEYKIISDSSAISAFCTHMATNLANFTLLSYMPTYFVDVLHLDMSETAPYLAPSRFTMLLGVVISGYLSKYILNNQLLTLTQTRRDGSCICLIGTAVSLCLLPLVESPLAAALCLCSSTFFIGSFEVFLQSTYIDLCSDSPEYAGFLCGSGNTLGAIPGALGPFFVSQILATFNSWVLVFWVMSLCSMVAALCHSNYGSANSISLDKNAKV